MLSQAALCHWRSFNQSDCVPFLILFHLELFSPETADHYYFFLIIEHQWSQQLQILHN